MNLIANFAILASRRMIFDVPVCDLGWDDALSFINELASLPVGQTVISFVNAHNMLLAVEDAGYRDVLQHNLVLPDGVGLDIASQVAHGAPFPANLNGTDFVPAFLTFMEKPKRIGLIGGKPEVLAGALRFFRRHTPWHDFIAISDGYFDKNDSGPIVEKVAAEKLDVLIIGMGTPLQEKWTYENIKTEHARLVLTVGALFDFVSGSVPRAPKAVRIMRMEWAYRLWQEPGRLWRRYIIGNPMFLFQVARYRFARRNIILSQPPVAPPEAPAALLGYDKPAPAAPAPAPVAQRVAT